MSMLCPKCGCDLGVIVTSADFDGKEVYRRRRCIECDAKFLTVEKIAENQYDVANKINHIKEMRRRRKR